MSAPWSSQFLQRLPEANIRRIRLLVINALSSDAYRDVLLEQYNQDRTPMSREKFDGYLKKVLENIDEILDSKGKEPRNVQ